MIAARGPLIVGDQGIRHHSLFLRKLLHSSCTFSPLKTSRMMTRRSINTEIEDPEGAAQPLSETEATSPFAGALPKAEIQGSQFLAEYPEYDGRGVVIAILDTGVDPGAAGLQTTTDGKPKIIDVVDCTGSGDVDVSKEVEADADGFVEGVYEKRMRVNPQWKNPSGKWRVGAKPAFELFPAGLTKRIKEERRRRFEEQQRKSVTSATIALAAHQREHGQSMPKDIPIKKAREELENRIKLLEEMMSKYEDVGPMIEAVVWNDGEKWLVALDTSDFYSDAVGEDNDNVENSGTKRGSLEEFEPLTNYRDCLRYGTFSPADACNFAVNIYDEGKMLSIVVDAGSHGTHVAGIAAAHHPESPDLNGIAPGAQIVSCKIGDTRLGSMETNVGLTRALIAVLENKCDLINMSYGEAAAAVNAGRFVRLAEEIVYKHNVIYVASAGNAGPALGTVGAPGGTSSALLGVGAFVTPALAEAGHSLRTALSEGAQYTWSSRGPVPDGDLGVTFSAPGGAIAPIPSWTASKMQLMNGTSMASPCACGGLALLLSGMKSLNQPVTPARVRRAVENTALESINGSEPAATLTHGRGLLQVHSAFEYLRRGSGTHLDDVLYDLRFDVSARRTDGSTRCRGIYLREPKEVTYPTAFLVSIAPELKEDADVQSLRLAIDLKVSISCTADWIKAPSLLMLHHGGRSIEVEVDPSNLDEGVHYGEVRGTIAGEEWRGPIFRVPVTVVKPTNIKSMMTALERHGSDVSSQRDLVGSNYDLEFGKIDFTPGLEVRRFVAVPEGTTWAELRLTSVSGETQKHYMVRATSVLPQTRYSDCEFRTSIQLPPHSEHVSTFAVTEGATLELTLAQFWSSLGDSAVRVTLSFHGVKVDAANRAAGAGGGAGGVGGSSSGALLLDGNAAAPLKFFAKASFRREKTKPSAKLDTLRLPLRPSETELIPLSEARDALPGGRTIHRLLLVYNTSLSEDGKIIPHVPLLNRFVYDSEIEAQMSFICDKNKQCLAVNDIYPSSVDLKKGEYTIRLMLRHEDPALLEKLRALPLVLEKKLDSPILIPIYGTAAAAINKGGVDVSGKERALVPGERIALFLGPLPEDAKIPKDASPGHLLMGKLSIGCKSNGGGEAPGSAQIAYVVPAAKKGNSGVETSTNGGKSAEAETSIEQALKEKIRDAQVEFLKAMKLSTPKEKEMYENLLQEVKKEWPSHLPILQEALNRLKSPGGMSETLAEGSDEKAIRLNKIIDAADAVLSAIDLTELAVYFARKCPEDTPNAADRKKKAEEQRSAVVEALAAKMEALMDLEEESGRTSAAVVGDDDPVETAYESLCCWVDPTADAKRAVLAARREERASRFAASLKALDKILSSNDDDGAKHLTKEAMIRRVALFEKMGWDHWARLEKARICKRFPYGWPTM